MMRHLLLVVGLLLAGASRAGEPVLEAGNLTCKATDATGAVLAEGHGKRVSDCMHDASEKYQVSCEKPGVLDVNWAVQGDMTYPCLPSKAPPPASKEPGEKKATCKLATADGSRASEAAELNAVRCEWAAKFRFLEGCEKSKPVAATLSLASTADKLTCLPKKKAPAKAP